MHATRASRQLDEPRFTAAQCDALFAAIGMDDKIDLSARLPAWMPIACDQELLVECYRLCRQLWQDGVHRGELLRIVDGMCRHGSPAPGSQETFKNIRAKFKHLRFACALFSAPHRYPPAFHLVTSLMGTLQDAFKNDQRRATIRFAWLLRLMLTRMPCRWMKREIDAFEPTTPEGFRQYLADDVDSTRVLLAHDGVSGKEFHALRKVVSRQSALFCDLGVLAPSPGYYALARYVATLNGMMGEFHDRLIRKHFDEVQHYRTDRFAIPATIRERMVALVQWYREP